MPCPHNEISMVQRSQQQSAVAAAAYQSGEKLFCEYDQEVSTTRKSVVSSTMKSCSRQMPHGRMQTAIPYGTPPKRWKNNGILSLQGGGCLPSPERYRLASTLSLSGSFASSSLFPKA